MPDETRLNRPGEAAEVRSIARRLLREAARGVSFEDMGVVLPRPQTYAPLFTDLLSRLGIPHRLHPSLPLRFGRAARLESSGSLTVAGHRREDHVDSLFATLDKQWDLADALPKK